MAASGTRKATLPVLAVERSGSLVPARTIIVSGPGPEAIGQLVEQRIGVARQFVGLPQAGNQQRKRLVLLAGLDLVDLLHGVQVHRVHGQAVKGVGRQRDHTAFAQAGDDVIDPVWLGFIGMNAQNFRRQSGLPRFPNRKIERQRLQNRKLSQHQPWCKFCGTKRSTCRRRKQL